MHKSILDPTKSYTFSDYFNLAYSTRDVVAEFGFEYRLEKITLPTHAIDHLKLDRLRETFYRKLPHISLNSEAAKREFFISPLLLELLDYVEANIDIEYPLSVDQQLKGNIDYVIRSTRDLIIIEAKNADMERGFTQLAVELIGMDRDLNEKTGFLYGAVTVGDVWRFGVLDRDNRLILKDMAAFVVPADLEKLFAVFLGILD